MYDFAIDLNEHLPELSADDGGTDVHDRETGQDQILDVIRHALEHDRFVLFGQRIVPFGNMDQEHRRTEILLRLVTEDQRVLSPDFFIPTAEQSGLIRTLDRHLMRKVFSVLAGEMTRSGELPESVNVNVSGATVSEPEFREYVAQALTYYRLPPESICFEITETAAITDFDAAKAFVSCMQEMGAEIALDDFGSGYSSLGYLQKLPVNYLKIPRRFVSQLVTTPVDQAIVESICKLAERTGMQTVAEGVEDEATLCLLRSLGCDHAQGYYLHRPEPWPVSPLPPQSDILRFPARYRAH